MMICRRRRIRFKDMTSTEWMIRAVAAGAALIAVYSAVGIWAPSIRFIPNRRTCTKISAMMSAAIAAFFFSLAIMAYAGSLKGVAGTLVISLDCVAILLICLSAGQ